MCVEASRTTCSQCCLLLFQGGRCKGQHHGAGHCLSTSSVPEHGQNVHFSHHIPEVGEQASWMMWCSTGGVMWKSCSKCLLHFPRPTRHSLWPNVSWFRHRHWSPRDLNSCLDVAGCYQGLNRDLGGPSELTGSSSVFHHSSSSESTIQLGWAQGWAGFSEREWKFKFKFKKTL